MKTEKLVSKKSNRCLNVVANQVESLRINNSKQNTFRIYDNGFIGVDGSLGEADWEQLEQSAKAKLAQGIDYPETHSKQRVLTVDATKHIFDEKDFIPAVQHLLDRLGADNPQFLFSNKVQLNSSEDSYENSDGERYLYRGNQFLLSLAIKLKGSPNIMDEGYGAESLDFDEDAICRDVKLICDAFLNKLPHVEEDEVTVIGGGEPLQYAIQHLIADLYFNNASLFADKLGQKLFNDKLSITINRNPAEQINLPFFDAEGVVNEGYVNYLVKNGVLERLLTCKKSAAQYDTPNLGCAGAAYNGVPNVGAEGLDVQNTATDLCELVKGKAVFVSDTGGGDMTPSGDISMPVMTAYLFENGKLLGRLPEFVISANIFQLLGDDFVGVTDSGLFKFGKQKHFVYKAKIVNKA